MLNLNEGKEYVLQHATSAGMTTVKVCEAGLWMALGDMLKYEQSAQQDYEFHRKAKPQGTLELVCIGELGERTRVAQFTLEPRAIKRYYHLVRQSVPCTLLFEELAIYENGLWMAINGMCRRVINARSGGAKPKGYYNLMHRNHQGVAMTKVLINLEH